MLFNSTEFIVFFLMVTALVYAVPNRSRWPVLLLASCYFYMVFVPKYILILLVLIVVDYGAGLLLGGMRGGARKVVLVCSLIANIGMLGFFKYFHFAEHELARVCSWLGIIYRESTWNVVLPIGLSFHTFQSMSYTIEVYRGKQPTERHFGIYALYVLFYPQMVAGPIERPQNLLHQFHERVVFHASRLIEGGQLIVWGLFKKMVIADNLALIVNPAFSDPAAHRGLAMWIATYAFAIQIYCDFSGYTDIARGAARSMGYELMQNFNVPYLARSVAEFWRRWHISLSTWFKDYLYVPLGGNRCGLLRNYSNILVVFLISGLWHGASWAFVIWGFLHGSYIIAGNVTRRVREILWRRAGFQPEHWLRHLVSGLITFHLVLIAWVFFRAGKIRAAQEVFFAMGRAGMANLIPSNFENFYRIGLVFALVVLALASLIQERIGLRKMYHRTPTMGKTALFAGGVALIFLWGSFDARDFIYFQF